MARLVIIAHADHPDLLPFYDLQFHHRVQWLRENWREGLRALEAELYIIEFRIGSPIYAPEVIDRLQQERPGMPRLLITGHQLSPDARALLAARGTPDILGLPVERLALTQTVARCAAAAPPPKLKSQPQPAPAVAAPAADPIVPAAPTSRPEPGPGVGLELRRAHPRSDAYLPMVFSAMDLNQIMEVRDNARVTNISRGGFRFLTPRRYHVGKEIYFLIRGAGGTTMRGRFEVLRVTPKGDLKEVAGRIAEVFPVTAGPKSAARGPQPE